MLAVLIRSCSPSFVRLLPPGVTATSRVCGRPASACRSGARPVFLKMRGGQGPPVLGSRGALATGRRSPPPLSETLEGPAWPAGETPGAISGREPIRPRRRPTKEGQAVGPLPVRSHPPPKRQGAESGPVPRHHQSRFAQGPRLSPSRGPLSAAPCQGAPDLGQAPVGVLLGLSESERQGGQQLGPSKLGPKAPAKKRQVRSGASGSKRHQQTATRSPNASGGKGAKQADPVKDAA